jgi:hypothetical protein
VLFAHNLADRPVTVRVPDISAHAGQLVNLFHAQKNGAPELDGFETGRLRLPLDPARRSHCSVSRPARLRSS